MKNAILLTVLIFVSFSARAEPHLFRYKNSAGVTVITHSLPPQYAQQGYDIVTLKGSLIRSVAPALSKDEVDSQKARKALLAKYIVLKRRYSSPKDIEGAKKRRLASIKTNIAIIKANINNLDNQINGLMTKAAQFERSGRPVPTYIIKELEGAKVELATTLQQKALREQEMGEVEAKFDQDSATFSKAQAIFDQKNKQHRDDQTLNMSDAGSY